MGHDVYLEGLISIEPRLNEEKQQELQTKYDGWHISRDEITPCETRSAYGDWREELVDLVREIAALEKVCDGDIDYTDELDTCNLGVIRVQGNEVRDCQAEIDFPAFAEGVPL